MQIHLDLTSNYCKSPREEVGVFTVNSIPELQALSKSVKAMNCSSSSVETYQEKKFHMRNRIREMIPMGFFLSENEENSSLFLDIKAHTFPSSVRFLRKLLNLRLQLPI